MKNKLFDLDYLIKSKNKLKWAYVIEIFNSYDKDGNGFIGKKELDQFLEDLVKNKTDEEIDRDELQRIKEEILSTYDEDSDGRISLKEIGKILPTEENFLLQYRDEKNLNIVDFIKIWYHYDINRNGYLEANELKGFLHDLEEDTNNPIDPIKLDEYVTAMLDLFDANNDGKIELTELSQLLPMEENFLLKFNEKDLSPSDFEEIFQHYDRNNNGYIEGHEVLAFLKDLTAKQSGKAPSNILELEEIASKINLSIKNENKLTKDDLKLLLCK